MTFSTLLFIMATSLFNPQLEFNFEAEGNAPKTWTIQNDDVMGGVSEGTVQWKEEGFLWYGHTRLENNGGFSSIRSPWKSFDLSKFETVRIRCKVIRFGLMKYDGTAQPFELEVASVSFE